MARKEPHAGACKHLPDLSRVCPAQRQFSHSASSLRRFSFSGIFRAISTARLNVSPRLHLRPIDVVVFDGPYDEI